MRCPTRGGYFGMRDLTQVWEHDGPLPHPGQVSLAVGPGAWTPGALVTNGLCAWEPTAKCVLPNTPRAPSWAGAGSRHCAA
jgi:hypothetical protein